MTERTKTEGVKDPESGLVVRQTDNGVKEGDPEQWKPDLAEPLTLDENGLPIGYKGGQ
ncbi:MAG: hypothetical protein FWF88_10675 [Peptococcaceae bacterium]|nr:hypothetical protein [Peptococcaceae bacterium]